MPTLPAEREPEGNAAMPQMRVLLTGATGFLGRHCLDRLLATDVAEIHAVSRSGKGEASPRVASHAVDLLRTNEAEALLAEVRPTHLVHAAWIATPGIYGSSPENLAWLRASVALFEAFGRNGGRRLVGLGTSAEYAPVASPARETLTPLAPQSIYGRCKLACGFALGAAAEAHGFSAAWMRVFLPFGPGDTTGRLIPTVLAALRAGNDVPLTDGTQVRDFIYAPDIADMTVRLLQSNEQGAFNCGTGRGVAVRDVIAGIAAQLGAGARLKFGAIPMRPGEPPNLVADMSEVRTRLGWHAPTPLAEALAKTIAADPAC